VRAHLILCLLHAVLLVQIGQQLVAALSQRFEHALTRAVHRRTLPVGVGVKFGEQFTMEQCTFDEFLLLPSQFAGDTTDFLRCQLVADVNVDNVMSGQTMWS
jgi:hypothetical protein